MRRLVIWLLAVALGAGAAVLAFFPAGWLGAVLERESDGRLTLGEAQGTLWRGSAVVGGAAGARGAVAPLLPGRLEWRLSPLLLLGVLDLQLEQRGALAQPVSVRGSWSHWQVSPGALALPAERLAALGAPLNTLAPSGAVRLSWGVLEMARAGPAIAVSGRTTLELREMASALSAIRPLGSYEMALDWHERQAQLTLRSLRGPLLLDGGGTLRDGRLQFSGQAQAAPGYEETLANLLNLLGQRRTDSDKNIIALEFR